MIAGVLLWTLLVTSPPPAVPSHDPSEFNPRIQELLEAIHKAPTDPRARLELGMAYAEAEEYELAMSELVEAIRLNPENIGNMAARANFHLGLVLSILDRPALAGKAYQEALRLGMKEAPVYVALGGALIAEGKYAEAIDQYQQAVVLSPDSFPANVGLGMALEGSGRVEEALARYEAALHLAAASDDHAAEAIRQRMALLNDRRKL